MKISFRNRVLFTIFCATLICTIAAVFVAKARIRHQGEDALIDKSKAILSRLEIGRKYVADMGTLKGKIDEAKEKFPDGKISEEMKSQILKSVPVYAAFKLGEEGAEKEHYRFRVFSDKPRNLNNQANEQESRWYSRFRSEPSLEEIVEVAQDYSSITVVRPVKLTQNCLACHGHPSTSPWGNGKDVLGIQMENMKEGDLKGAFAVISSLAPVKASTDEATTQILIWSGGFDRRAF